MIQTQIYFKFLTLCISLFASILYCQTDIPEGDISGTWTKDGSPYYINGHVTIPNGNTLKIKPGVEVNFKGHFKFDV